MSWKPVGPKLVTRAQIEPSSAILQDFAELCGKTNEIPLFKHSLRGTKRFVV